MSKDQQKQPIRLKIYLPLALCAFLAATTGADLVARTSIAGESFTTALSEHLYWARVQLIGTILLLAPFVAVALVCARIETQARSRGVAVVFASAMVMLLYFYVRRYLGAQQALLEEKWTAAALSIGLLPFFIGVPVVVATVCAGLLVLKVDRRGPGEKP